MGKISNINNKTDPSAEVDRVTKRPTLWVGRLLELVT